MVILDVQLWELGTQRLHQGMSETILVNTLTDVREFKNILNNINKINRLTMGQVSKVL